MDKRANFATSSIFIFLILVIDFECYIFLKQRGELQS